MPYVYILRCCDGTFYTGSTNDLQRRLGEHMAGLGANYTRRRLPVELAFCQWYDRVFEAFAMEKRMQGWSHQKKQAVIQGRFEDLPDLSSGGG